MRWSEAWDIMWCVLRAYADILSHTVASYDRAAAHFRALDSDPGVEEKES